MEQTHYRAVVKGDPDVATLQKHTIDLYPELEDQLCSFVERRRHELGD